MSEVSSEAVEAARQAAYQMYVTDEGQTLATRDLTNAIADAALTAALPYLAAHQPARVVPSAEEDPEPEFVQYAPEEAVGNDDDLVQWAFDKGVTWGEWHERHKARTETKGGE